MTPIAATALGGILAGASTDWTLVQWPVWPSARRPAAPCLRPGANILHIARINDGVIRPFFDLFIQACGCRLDEVVRGRTHELSDEFNQPLRFGSLAVNGADYASYVVLKALLSDLIVVMPSVDCCLKPDKGCGLSVTTPLTVGPTSPGTLV